MILFTLSRAVNGRPPPCRCPPAGFRLAAWAAAVMLADMKIPRPTRRWFQFSLRTLLVFVTLSAIPCSWLAVKLREVKREEAAAAAIEKVGGRVDWDENAAGPAWLRGVLGEHFFAHVIRVASPGDQVTGSTLEPLDAMNHLQVLDLYHHACYRRRPGASPRAPRTQGALP